MNHSGVNLKLIDEFRYVDNNGNVVESNDPIKFGKLYKNDDEWSEWTINMGAVNNKMTTETRTRPVWQDYIIPSTEQKQVRECDVVINGVEDDPAPTCNGDNFKWVEIEELKIESDVAYAEPEHRPVPNPWYVDPADTPVWGEFEDTNEFRFIDGEGNVVNSDALIKDAAPYRYDAEWSEWTIQPAAADVEMTTRTRTRPIWQDYIVPGKQQKQTRECDAIINGDEDVSAPSCEGDAERWITVLDIDSKTLQLDTEN